MILVIAVVMGSLVTAGPETFQAGKSWPHEVRAEPTGPTAYEMLTEIHDLAILKLPDADPVDKPNIVRVLKAAFVCAAMDGTVPLGDPPPPEPPPHFLQHMGAAQKVKAARDALFKQPDAQHPQEWQDWLECADNLEHGHD
jgi:hypothetical protein